MNGLQIELPNSYLFQELTGEIILHHADLLLSIPLTLQKCMYIFSKIEKIPNFNDQKFMTFYNKQI